MLHIDLNALFNPIVLLILGTIAGIIGDRLSEGKRTKRERIEEISKLSTGIYCWLYTHVYEQVGWETDNVYSHYYRSEPTKEPKQDMERIKAIINLFFPELENFIIEYEIHIDSVVLGIYQVKKDNTEENINDVKLSHMYFQKHHAQLKTLLKNLSRQRKLKIKHLLKAKKQSIK